MKRLAIVLLACASAAYAKPPPEIHTGTNTNRETSQPHYSTGSTNSGEMEAQATDKALAVGRGVARCVVGRRPADVKTVLDAPDADAFQKRVARLDATLGDCLAFDGHNEADFAVVELGPSSMAGLLAEAMLVRQGMPTLTPAKYDANAPKLDRMAGSEGSLVQLRLAECLSQTQPEAVSALVRSVPSSPQEASAFRAVAPAIPACLDKNVTLKATKNSLRLALAFALYRRTLAPVETGAVAR